MEEETLKGQVPIVDNNNQIVGIINFEIRGQIAIINELEGIAIKFSKDYLKELVWQSLEMYSLLHPDEMEIINPNRIRSFNINLTDSEKGKTK